MHEFVKVSGGSRTLVCIKGFTFSHFSGKASAGAPDTRHVEAPPGKCKKQTNKQKKNKKQKTKNIYIYIYINKTHLMQTRHIS